MAEVVSARHGARPHPAEKLGVLFDLVVLRQIMTLAIAERRKQHASR